MSAYRHFSWRDFRRRCPNGLPSPRILIDQNHSAADMQHREKANLVPETMVFSSKCRLYFRVTMLGLVYFC